MHKIFAKPIFLGKKVVFLPECHSTNDELSQLARNGDAPEGMVIYSDHQLSGKGQRGNHWIDQPAKNVLLSLLLRPKFLPIKNQFFLNLIIGLAIVDALKEKLPSRQIKLKWPNDVYVDDRKIAGILIENSLRGTAIESSVNGMGINLNQVTSLPPNATSLSLELGAEINRQDFIEDLLSYVEVWYRRLKAGSYDEILWEYHELLYWRNESHIFARQGNNFRGVIKGIDEAGRLVIKTGQGESSFGLKEVQFIE